MAETVPQKYMDQAISGGNTYTPGMNPRVTYWLSKPQFHILLLRLQDPWTALDVRPHGTGYLVYDNANSLVATMSFQGHLLEVDSSPALNSDRPLVMQAIFWQRFWQAMYIA